MASKEYFPIELENYFLKGHLERRTCEICSAYPIKSKAIEQYVCKNPCKLLHAVGHDVIQFSETSPNGKGAATQHVTRTRTDIINNQMYYDCVILCA